MNATFEDTFFRKYPQRTLKRGTQLLLIGDSVEEVFYITSGVVSQYDISSSGEKIIMNSFKQGAYMPMSNVINKLPSRYFYEIRSKEAVVHVAPARDVIVMLKENPDVLYDLLSRVYRGVDGVLERMNHMMSGTASERIWQQLTVCAVRFGEPTESPDVKKVRMTVGHLAEHTGLARETVSRELNKLKKTGLVNMPKQGIIWVDLQSRSRL